MRPKAYKNIYILKLAALPMMIAVGSISALFFDRSINRDNYHFTGSSILFVDLRPDAPYYIMTALTAASCLLSVIALVILIAALVNKEKLVYVISRAAIVVFLDMISITVFAVGMSGYYYSCHDSFFEDFYPEFYCYEHDGHRIVIAEGAYLFCGRTRIYEVFDDSTAWQIGEFDTDDGYVNCGRYDMRWTDECVEISYHDGISDISRNVSCSFTN